MIRAIFISIGLMILAACATPPPATEATAPQAQAPAEDPRAVKVRADGPGVIRVTGGIADRDALAPLHCAAAQQAIRDGAKVLEWVGGIAAPRGEEFDADFVYETTAPEATRLALDAKPADGGVVPVENWLIYCDEAGIPREGKA
ncbi:MAG: hypothetical protein AAF367_16910 [Pseudomonadota bacterium]